MIVTNDNTIRLNSNIKNTIIIDKVTCAFVDNRVTIYLPTHINGVDYSNWRLKNNDAIENFKAKHINGYAPQHMSEDMTLNRDRLTKDNLDDVRDLFNIK